MSETKSKRRGTSSTTEETTKINTPARTSSEGVETTNRKTTMRNRIFRI